MVISVHLMYQLYFIAPDPCFEISQYNIYLYLVRIDKSTNLILDSAGIPSDGIDIFKDWTKMGNNGNYEIKDYNYVIRTSFPSRDTLTDISYNKSITSQPCGTCTDGRNTNINITTYQNFNYKCKGKTYRDIDTLVIGK